MFESFLCYPLRAERIDVRISIFDTQGEPGEWCWLSFFCYRTNWGNKADFRVVFVDGFSGVEVLRMRLQGSGISEFIPSLDKKIGEFLETDRFTSSVIVYHGGDEGKLVVETLADSAQLRRFWERIYFLDIVLLIVSRGTIRQNS
jgi:hypothetical protein